MARIRGTIAYGVKIELNLPLAPAKEQLDGIVAKGRTVLKVALDQAVRTSLKLLPFVTLTITESDVKLTVDDVQH